MKKSKMKKTKYKDMNLSKKKYTTPVVEFESIEPCNGLCNATVLVEDPETEEWSKGVRQFSLFDKNIVDEDEFDPHSVIWGE